jgi:hypothetical protein
MTLHESIAFAMTEHPDRFAGALKIVIKEDQDEALREKTAECDAAYERIGTIESCLKDVRAYLQHLVRHGCEDLWMLEKVEAVLADYIEG